MPSAGRDADEQAVEEAQRRLLGDQPALGAGLEVAQRHAAQRHRQRLAAGIAGLAGHHRQEDGEDDELAQRILEQPTTAAATKAVAG